MNRDKIFTTITRIDYLVEALINILESDNSKILIDAFYDQTKANMESNYQELEEFITENYPDFYAEYEDELCSAFCDGPDAVDWTDAWCGFGDYISELNKGMNALRNFTKLI